MNQYERHVETGKMRALCAAIKAHDIKAVREMLSFIPPSCNFAMHRMYRDPLKAAIHYVSPRNEKSQEILKLLHGCYTDIDEDDYRIAGSVIGYVAALRIAKQCGVVVPYAYSFLIRKGQYKYVTDLLADELPVESKVWSALLDKWLTTPLAKRQSIVDTVSLILRKDAKLSKHGAELLQKMGKHKMVDQELRKEITRALVAYELADGK